MEEKKKSLVNNEYTKFISQSLLEMMFMKFTCSTITCNVLYIKCV